MWGAITSNLLMTTVEGFWNYLSQIIGDRLRWGRSVEVNYSYKNNYRYKAIIIKDESINLNFLLWHINLMLCTTQCSHAHILWDSLHLYAFCGQQHPNPFPYVILPSAWNIFSFQLSPFWKKFFQTYLRSKLNYFELL